MWRCVMRQRKFLNLYLKMSSESIYLRQEGRWLYTILQWSIPILDFVNTHAGPKVAVYIFCSFTYGYSSLLLHNSMFFAIRRAINFVISHWRKILNIQNKILSHWSQIRCNNYSIMPVLQYCCKVILIWSHLSSQHIAAPMGPGLQSRQNACVCMLEKWYIL